MEVPVSLAEPNSAGPEGRVCDLHGLGHVGGTLACSSLRRGFLKVRTTENHYHHLVIDVFVSWLRARSLKPLSPRQ